ncbi:FxsA family membrane protein [Streptomyces qinzhouensis]|uniref:FxsA family protein n=1 Tax=Streptomyces qinzhouensis TaxID=2599401 RepID=A0A5B8J3G7_9ACTN|nr:FxsA family membrane protein [Streptomyces qinzhouensis]QDY75807.1 FxsA family protein [Streptomyces qinzhouensis]
MTTGPVPPRAPQRSRARLFILLGSAAWFALEIWLLVLVGGAIGTLPVLALLLAQAVAGAAIVKRAGRNAFRNLTETLQRAQQPGAPGAAPDSSGNGFLMLAGGLIMVPGFASDVLGLVLLVPPVRKWLSRYTQRSLERRMRAAGPGTLGGAFNQARMHRPDGKVVPGEVIHPDPASPAPGPDGAGESPRIIEGRVIRPEADDRP